MNTMVWLSTTPGLTVYARIARLDGALYNNTAAAFEAANAAHVALYARSAPDPSGLGLYGAAMPGGLPAGSYTATFYQQGGAGPAATDPFIGGGVIRWGGDAVGELDDAANGTALSTAAHTQIVADATAALQGLYGGLVATGTVADDNPVADAFVVTLDGSQVLPNGPNFVGLSLCFTAGILTVSKRTIAGYQWVDASHARLSFDAPFAGVPSRGDAFHIL